MAQQAKTRERFSPPAVGGISLLVVFAVLCLTVFALLALTTVQADTRLADASAQSVADYYAADYRAQEVLARLRSNGDWPQDVEIEIAGAVVSYAVPISDRQELQVEVELDWMLPDAEPDSRGYTILRWQAVPTGEWEGDESLDIWDGT